MNPVLRYLEAELAQHETKLAETTRKRNAVLASIETAKKCTGQFRVINGGRSCKPTIMKLESITYGPAS